MTILYRKEYNLDKLKENLSKADKKTAVHHSTDQMWKKYSDGKVGSGKQYTAGSAGIQITGLRYRNRWRKAPDQCTRTEGWRKST